MLKSLTLLARQVLQELGELVGTDTTHDWETVMRRLNTEGLSFLTITLPQFGKAFERALDRGCLLPSDFPGFKNSRRSECLPAFLQGFTSLVFDRKTGTLLDVPSTEAIRDVRQFCLMFQKIELPTSSKREARAFHQYIQCEQEVAENEKSFANEGDFGPLRTVFIALFGDICSRLDSFIYHLDDSITPKHGPGSTADRLGSNERWRLSTWTERLETVLPHWFMSVPNERVYQEILDPDSGISINFLEPGAEPPVRVISVPKTLKTPRIIAIEPAHMQYVQQALKGLLVDEIARSELVGPLISFDDQTRNQILACYGSSSGSLATLDLSEASDRVSNLLVRNMFRNWPNLNSAIQACRTEQADVPGHGVLRLSKFASMGSALTFPIEAMMFLSVIVLSLTEGKQLRVPGIRKLVKDLPGSVAVFGDDLIVPKEKVHCVIENLILYGFKVNSDKSFWSGRFRESCGKDYYAGEDVSIVRVRHVWPSSRKHATEAASLVSLRNQLYYVGLWKTARWLDRRIEPLFGGYYPTVPSTSSVLGRHSFVKPSFWDHQNSGWNERLQHPAVRGWCVVGSPPIDEIDGYAALSKVLMTKAVGTSVDGFRKEYDPRPIVSSHDHLMRAGRPKSLNLKLRWTESF